MRQALKALAILVLVAAALGLLNLWYQTFVVGMYYASAGIFLTIMGYLAPIIVIVAAVFTIVKIVKF